MLEWIEQITMLGPSWQALRERGKARRERRLFFIVGPRLKKKEEKAILSGNIKRVIKAFRAEEKLEKRESAYIFIILKKMRIIIGKQLEILKEIKHAILEDIHKFEQKREENKDKLEVLYALRNRIEEEAKIVEDLIAKLINYEDNLAHEGLAPHIKQLLDMASIINDFYFLTRQERRRVRRAFGDEKKLRSLLERGVPSIKRIQDIMHRVENDLKAETQNELREATDIMLILYSIEKDIKNKEAKISELVTRQGFPLTYGEKLEKEFEEVEHQIQETLKLDTKKDRYLESVRHRV